MDGNEKGEIRILSAPVKPEELARAADYLIKVLRKKPEEKAKAEAALRKAPLLLARNVTRTNAEKLIPSLAKVGVRAVFQPAKPGALTEPEAPRPKPPAKPTAKQKVMEAAGSPVITEKPQPPEEVSPPERQETPLHGNARRRRASMAGLVIFLALCAAGYYLLSGGPVATTNPSFPARIKPTQSVALTATHDSATAQELLSAFDKAHAPFFDRRLAEGLAEGIRAYARLFPSGPKPARVEVSYQHQQLSPLFYRLKFEIRLAESSHYVEVEIIADPDNNMRNIPALSKALAEAVEKLGRDARAPGILIKEPAGAAEIGAQAMEKFSAPAFFKALAALGALAGPVSVDPDALLEAGNLFSWLAYAKSAAQIPTQADMLAAHAVANHLLASLFIDPSDKKLAHGRATLWLGLGYPAAALAELAGAQPGAQDWVAMASGRNVERAQKAAKSQPGHWRLAAYLEARLRHEGSWIGESEPALLEIIRRDPDFMIGVEYAIAEGSVTTARLAPLYLMESSKQGLDMVYELADGGWMERDNGFMERSAAIKQGQAGIEDMLKLGVEALKKTTSLKDGDRILTYNFLSRYITAQMMGAAYLCFWAEQSVFSRMEETESYAQMIQRTWPDSSVSQLARLQYLWSSEGFESAYKFSRRLKLDSADRRLLEEMAEIQTRVPLNDPARVIKLAEAMRLKTDPTPASALRQVDILWRLGRRPASRDMIRRALGQDPLDARIYCLAGRLPEADSVFQQAQGALPGSAKLFICAGDWAREAKSADVAIGHYRRAKLLTNTDIAVTRLADIYLEMNDYEKAEEVLTPYVKRADDSFGYVHVKNMLADVLLRRNMADQAYGLLKEAKESWQMTAMTNFARAAEMMGEKVEAAMFYRMAAERYPTGLAPAQLAFFHLRHGEKDQALGLIRDHMRFNSKSYYFPMAIDHFKQAQDPDGILDFVNEVNNEPIGADLTRSLISSLMSAGLPQVAAKAAKPFMIGPGPDQPFIFAGLFYQAALRIGPEEEAPALEEALRALADDKKKWRYLGAWLHMRGLYTQAFKVYDRYAEAAPRYTADTTQLMAPAWLLSGGGPEGKAILARNMAAPALGPWSKTVVGYYLGETPEDKLLYDAKEEHLVEALYAAGVSRQARGNQEEAEKFYIMAMETGADKSAEYQLALYATLGEQAFILP